MLERPLGKNAMPLYSRIESLIRNKIFSGQYEPAEKLPSEEQLLKQFRVSKITVRNALLHLETEGLIVRIPGKGTFVSENILPRKRLIFSGGIKDIIEDAKRYQTIGVEIQTVKVGQTRIARIVRNFFNLSNQDEVCRIKRIRTVSGNPIYIIENFMLPDVAKHIMTEDLFHRPLLEVIKERIGMSVDHAEMYIESIPAEPDIAEVLECQPFDPLGFMQFYYWFPSKVPFEVCNCFVRGDYFRYKIDLHASGYAIES